jgi:hypothetical protein
MKISNESLAILKNFASIQSNLLIEPGSKIRTVSPGKHTIAEATLAEVFPVQIGIYDLNKLLATATTLFKDPDFDFQEKCVKISSGSASVKYFYADPSLLTVLTKNIKMPEAQVEFELPQSLYAEIQKAASVLQVPDLALVGTDDGVYLRVYDKDPSDSSNNYSVKVLDSIGRNFQMNFKIENLRFIPGNYHVKVSSQKISSFTNTSGQNVTYYVALEHDSVW